MERTEKDDDSKGDEDRVEGWRDCKGMRGGGTLDNVLAPLV